MSRTLRRARHRRRSGLVGVCLLGVALASRASAAGALPPGDRPMALSAAPIRGCLSTGDVRRHEVALEAGEYVRILVTQDGIDLGVSLLGPDGETFVELSHRSPEARFISTIAALSGLHQLQIAALETQPREGRYLVQIRDRRPATPADALRVEADRLLNEAESLWSQGEATAAARALERYRQAIERWEEAGDAVGQARAARRLGRAHHAMGDAGEAAVHLRRAVALGRQAADPDAECAALAALAWVEVDLGAMEEAEEHGRRALDLGGEGQNRRCQAAALNALGDSYSFTGRSPEALELYRQALAVGRDVRDRRSEAHALLNIGYTHADLGQVPEAQASYEAALTLWRATEERRGEARTLIGLAQLHGIVGEKQQALTHYRRARELVEAHGDRWGQAVVLSGMGAAYFQLGEAETAIGHYRQAVELFRSTKVSYGEAANLLLLGGCLAAVGRHDEALARDREALQIAQSISDRRLEERILQQVAQIQADTHQLAEALASYEKALALARTVGDPHGETDALQGIGDLLHRLGRRDEAGARLEEALRLAAGARDRFAESKALFALSRVETSNGNPEVALERIQASLALVEELRGDVASLDLRASYLASIRERHELEIDLLTRLHERDPEAGHDALAFEASERARARSLLEGLAEARTWIRQGVDPELLENETSLRRRLNVQAQRLSRMPRDGGEETAALEKEVDDLTLRYREVRARIRAESPRYAALMEPQPLSLEDVQRQVLDERSVLLQYFLGETRSYVWAVTPVGIHESVLPSRGELDQVVRPFREALVAPLSGRPRDAPDTPAGRSLAEKARAVSHSLLAPVADHLGAARIVVVADGILEALPFAVLPDPRRSAAEGAPPVPLVKEHEVVHLPSASTLALIRGAWQARRRWAKPLIVFADPVFEADDPRLAASRRRATPPPADDTPSSPARRPHDTDDPGSPAPARLLGSRREARRIADLACGADVALGFEASRAAALDPGVADHRFVHFATHAIVDDERPELSGVVLSLFDEHGTATDGFVRLHDVYNMKLPVDLVVLSGCSGALGREVAGEGLISLVRGFMYAGSRRVLASLWKVDDEATEELMIHLYRAMWKEGLSPSAALRAAQLEMIGQRRWSHPFYWAAFVLSGDWEQRAGSGASLSSLDGPVGSVGDTRPRGPASEKRRLP